MKLSSFEGTELRTTKWLVSLVFIISTASIAFGQSGQVTGLISDASNTAMANVKIELTNSKTGVSRSTVSNAQGNYTLPLLQPGFY